MRAPRRPTSFDVLGVVLACLGVLLVVAAGAGVQGLRDQATERRAAYTAFTQLEADAQELQQVVLAALARRRANDEVFTRVTAAGQRIDARLAHDVVTRDGRQATVGTALDALERYRTVAERLLAGIAVGNHTAGGADAALGPAFAQLMRPLEAIEAERLRQAADAERRAWAISALTAGALLVVLLVLLLVHQRGRRRMDVAASSAAALAASAARFRGLVDDSSDLVLLVDADGRISSANRAARTVLGVDPGALEGRSLDELVHAADLELLAAAAPADGHRTLELRMEHADGSWLTAEVVVNDMTADRHVAAVVLTVRDVSDRKAFEEQLRHRAFHDPLTQLANRALFSDRLQHALGREGRSDDRVAVLFVDLDDFKLVNDALGHAGGDEVLKAVAHRLRACLRSADTAARLGGDEFGVLLESTADLDQAVAVAERIIDALGAPFAACGLPVTLGASVGIALGTVQGAAADELLRNADIAMYVAKGEGKGTFVVFRPDVHDELGVRFPSRGEHDADRVTWSHRSEEQRNEVRRLLDRDDAVVPVFQPILDLGTGAVAGHEALSRFPHDDRGRPPNVWFAQAHRCGLGVQLETRAVLEALAVHAGGGAQGYVAVNASPAALRSDVLLDRLPADLGGVLVEITEHEIVADGERLRATLDDLRARGARIAVDDAGAGYAGLRQLMVLRPDVIKLDRSLVEDVAADEAKQALVECFVRFAERTGAAVCAEGIETLEDLGLLADLGVRYGQGYVIARPGPPWPEPSDAVTRVLAGRTAQALAV